jgi:hypothetical protein
VSVIPFPAREQAMSAGWRQAELRAVIDACAEPIARGDLSGCAHGKTEAGDPQLYVLGPAPEQECFLCVSRLGRNYVLEDGRGHILFEHDALEVLAQQMKGVLSRKKAAILARLMVAWVAAKETFEEKVEPAMAEPLEVVSHVAPQLAALI